MTTTPSLDQSILYSTSCISLTNYLLFIHGTFTIEGPQRQGTSNFVGNSARSYYCIILLIIVSPDIGNATYNSTSPVANGSNIPSALRERQRNSRVYAETKHGNDNGRYLLSYRCVSFSVSVRGPLWCNDRVDNQCPMFQFLTRSVAPKLLFVTPLSEYLPACLISGNILHIVILHVLARSACSHFADCEY